MKVFISICGKTSSKKVNYICTSNVKGVSIASVVLQKTQEELLKTELV